MDDFTLMIEEFGVWDWASIVCGLFSAVIGLFALKYWKKLPARLAPTPTALEESILSMVTAIIVFGLILGMIIHQLNKIFSTPFGFSQADQFTVIFIAQITSAFIIIIINLVSRTAVQWAPNQGDAATDSLRTFPRTLAGLTFRNVALSLFCIFGLCFALALTWKGIHFAWELLSHQGLAGPAPLDEQQDIVISVLKTDVDSWRFVMIVLTTVIGAPLIEELIFRGMIYPSLRNLGTKLSMNDERLLAILLTGGIFSLAHGNYSAGLPLFGFGAFMCLVRDRYGLLTCIAVHAGFNLWNLVWLKLAPNAANF